MIFLENYTCFLRKSVSKLQKTTTKNNLQTVVRVTVVVEAVVAVVGRKTMLRQNFVPNFYRGLSIITKPNTATYCQQHNTDNNNAFKQMNSVWVFRQITPINFIRIGF